MKIVICGSMLFYKQMLSVRECLQASGHSVMIPELASKSHLSEIVKGVYRDTAELKIKNDFIRRHYEKIAIADAVLILNYAKNGVKNYIGGNSFLEIGFAYILGKKIYLMNDIPQDEIYYEEIVAMKPVIIHGDFTLLTWPAKQLKFLPEMDRNSS